MKRILTLLAAVPMLASATPRPMPNTIGADFTKCTKPNPPGYCCHNPHSPYYHSPYYCPEPSTLIGVGTGAVAIGAGAIRNRKRRR